MPDSSVDRNKNISDSSSVLRASGRREINTIDKRNETAFWASHQGTASQSAIPPTIGTAATDRSPHPRRYAEDGDRTEELPRNGNVSFGRRNYRQEKEHSERRPDQATMMAPHSSGTLFPPGGARRGAEQTRVGSSHEAASSASSLQRAGFLGDEEEYDFGSGRGIQWDPYPDKSYDDEDDEQESSGRVSESRGVYKSARSKRRMSRNSRARAANGSSVGGRRRSVSGLDGGRARDDTTGGRTTSFS